MGFRSRHARRSGFTLLEVLLVVAILVALAALVVPNLFNVQSGANVDTAKIEVKGIYDAVKRFRIDNNRFPTSEEGLGALFQAPQNVKNYRGPYLEGSMPRLDPWQQAYNYQFPGSRSNSSGPTQMPDVWSNGPDMQSGTDDDIGNWNLN